MKLLMVGAFCLALGPLSWSQAANAKPADAKPPVPSEVPTIALHFKPVSSALAVSAHVYLGQPFCSSDGAVYLRAALPPDNVKQMAIVASRQGEISRYSLSSVMGLTGVTPLFLDAHGSHLYVLVEAAKTEVLRDNDINPDAPLSRSAAQYFHDFILSYSGEMAAPDIIQLSLPFSPMQFATMGKGKFVVLGFNRASQAPTLVVVNSSGDIDHYVDAYHAFGGNASLATNAPQYMKSDMPPGAYPGETEEYDLEGALVSAHFVHYRDSVLLLLPGSAPKVFTIQSGGGLTSTTLHLPAGLEADTLIPSNRNWYVRVSNGTSSGKQHIIMVDPTTGNVLETIQSPQIPAYLITCVHDGDYYGLHWTGKNDNMKMFLMEASN